MQVEFLGKNSLEYPSTLKTQQGTANGEDRDPEETKRCMSTELPETILSDGDNGRKGKDAKQSVAPGREVRGHFSAPPPYFSAGGFKKMAQKKKRKRKLELWNQRMSLLPPPACSAYLEIILCPTQALF